MATEVRRLPLLLEAADSPAPRHRRFLSDTVPNTEFAGVDASALTVPQYQHPHLDSRRSLSVRRTRPHYNPVVVLRNPPEIIAGDADQSPISNLELYYYDGVGSGLQPLPESMSDFLMTSGVDRVLNQLDGLGWPSNNPPSSLSSSKAAIEAMPTVEIVEEHIRMDCHCAVCKEAFELGSRAREMPCKHVYHQDCILPWLSRRSSCPVCRYQLATDVHRRSTTTGNDEEIMGLTVIRLPHGGYAIARMPMGQITLDIPSVYTEIDGNWNNDQPPTAPYRRRIVWLTDPSRQSGVFSRAFRRLTSLLGCFQSSSSS